MLTWLAAALAGLGVGVAMAWARRRVDELGRPRRFPWGSVGRLLAMASSAAVQRDAHTARLLGAAPADAAGLAPTYWRDLYPLMPDGCRSPACRAGGGLDERLPDAPWLASIRS